MTVFVTGAQGLIGCGLVARLLEEGEEVVALHREQDAASRFDEEGFRERCALARVALTELESIRGVLDEHGVHLIFHLAAQTQVGRANSSPLETWESNIRATYVLLEAARLHGGDIRVVVASSDKAYGAHSSLPYREDSPLIASYPYDVSKAAVDMIARSYAATFGLRVAVTRLANVYGPGDLNWDRVIPHTARALARGERPVIRSDGTPERDYLFVEDAANAYVAVGRSLEDPAMSGRAWNAGAGRPVAVIDVVRRLIDLSGTGIEPDVQGTGTPHAEIDRQYLDATAIREELGWEPRWSLDDGLRATLEWYRRAFG